jgi:hypothetical protein
VSADAARRTLTVSPACLADLLPAHAYVRLRGALHTSEKRLTPRFFNRVCEVGRQPGNQWECRLGDSAGERAMGCM